MLSNLAIKKVLEMSDQYDTVLDIGSGDGAHSKIFLEKGKKVTSIDYGNSEQFSRNCINNNEVITGDYLKVEFSDQFDMIWCSHVLEHQRNSGLFLEKIKKDLKNNGILCITVPPLKHNIVGGHVSLWNPLLLVYNLVLAGFNCKNVSIKKYEYNITAILKKQEIMKLPEIAYDQFDFEKLKEYLPSGFVQNVWGDISELNWE